MVIERKAQVSFCLPSHMPVYILLSQMPHFKEIMLVTVTIL